MINIENAKRAEGVTIMPSYKDTKANTWYCKFYYQDYEGNRKQKWKGGFLLKREADAWEREFLRTKNFQPDMLFSTFLELYDSDTSPRVREHTLQTRRYNVKNHILPFFADMPLNGIDAKTIVSWQNKLIKKGLAQKTLTNIHKCLSAIFNHAVRFYGLKNNPCKVAGSPRLTDQISKPMRFWTLEEYRSVIQHIDDIKAKTAIMLLYYSGMRKGELLALTWDKLDLEECTVTIDTSYQRLNGQPVITATKTGIARTIMLPEQVIEQLKTYKAACYRPEDSDFVFHWEKRFIEQGIKIGSEVSGVKRIHVHGLRHSHASLLIQMGVNIVLISKRLGHEKVSTTLDTYSHFFPTEEKSVIERLNTI